MKDLSEKLQHLGLAQYLDAFIAEGFDTWQTVLDITESDLSSLGVKLGHRRKLQRAIAEFRLQSHDSVIPLIQRSGSTIEHSCRSDESGPETHSSRRGEEASRPQSGKRKYRRHPKPDENAPERPASAYVIFSNETRQALKGQDLSFTEIAKIVGERWQILSVEDREMYERQAGAAKGKYYAELAEYKKTSEYAAYQKYLEDFRLKHGLIPKEGKRSKLTGTETGGTSTRSSSQENFEKSAARRPSVNFVDDLTNKRGGSGHSVPSNSTSPATYSFSSVNSPQIAEHRSPTLASPAYDVHSSSSLGVGSENRERRLDSSQHLPSLPMGHSYPHPAYMYSQTSQTGQLPGAIGMLHRRPQRDSQSLPSLTHEETTLSSEGGGLPPIQYQGPALPTVDVAKARRLLPQPIPTGTPGAVPPPLTHLQTHTSSNDQKPKESPQNSSLAVLLRAGELARDADTWTGNKVTHPM